MSRQILLIALLAVCIVVATNPPPVQVQPIRHWMSMCTKRKLMRANLKNRQAGPIANLTTILPKPHKNQTGYVYWGCVGPMPLTVTGVFQFSEQDFFHFFKTAANGAFDFFQAPTMQLTPHATKFVPLLLDPRRDGSVVQCSTGTAKVSAPRVQNITTHKGTGREGVWPNSLHLPPHLRRMNNFTNYYRVSLNMTCTLDFSSTNAGFHMFDLKVTTRGATFSVNKDPIILNVPQPTVLAVRGCGTNLAWQTTGCHGFGTTSVTIIGFGFSASTFHNRLTFTPINFARAATPYCALASVSNLVDTHGMNFTIRVNTSSTKQEWLKVNDPINDIQLQQIVCHFFMFGNPASPVTAENLRPFGQYLATVTVENKRVSTFGVKYRGRDMRPYLEISKAVIPQVQVKSKMTLIPYTSAICAYPMSCFTGKTVSVTARFIPMRVTSMDNLMTNIKTLKMSFSRVPSGVAPVCMTGTDKVTFTGNYSSSCYSALFSAYRLENPFCHLNVTLSCTLDMNNVVSGVSPVDVSIAANSLFEVAKPLRVQVYVEPPTVFAKHSTSCHPCIETDPGRDNKTITIRGYGFARQRDRNVVKFTPLGKSSAITPVCTIFSLAQGPANNVESTYAHLTSDEIHCRVVDFPVAGKSTYGYFAITVVSEGRVSVNSTTYFVQPLELKGLQGCDTPNRHNNTLHCSSPEFIDFVGIGIRNHEVSVDVQPAGALQCIEVSTAFYAVRYPHLNPIDSTKYYTCMLLSTNPGRFQIRLKQRDSFSAFRTIEIMQPRIVAAHGCSNVSGTMECSGMSQRIDVSVAWPSPIPEFNTLSISGGDFGGVMPWCSAGGRYNKTVPTVDIRHLIKPTLLNNATVRNYFGSISRFPGNLRSVQSFNMPFPFYMGRRGNMGPYTFTCYLNTIESTCPARRAAKGFFLLAVQRFGLNVAYQGPGFKVDGPKITQLDAAHLCGVRKDSYAWSRCDRNKKSSKLVLHGFKLEECTATPAPMKDRCGNDVSRYFACSVLFVPLDAPAKASFAPYCNFTYGFLHNGPKRFESGSRLECTLNYDKGDIAGRWAVGISVQGRSYIPPSNISLDFGTPNVVRINHHDSTCVSRSPSQLECVGTKNSISVTVDSAPAMLNALSFVPVDGTGAPRCASVSVHTRPMDMPAKHGELTNLDSLKPNANLTCVIHAGHVNQTLLGTWEVRVAGVATGRRLFIKWVLPAITSMDSKGLCDASGCPYPAFDIKFTGVALNHGTFSFKALKARGDHAPKCVPTKRTWDTLECRLRLETAAPGHLFLEPLQGTWYPQHVYQAVWDDGVTPWNKKYYTSRGPTFTSRVPEIHGIVSKNCPTLEECTVGGTTELTIIGKYFAASKSDLTVSVSGGSGTYTCEISNTTATCNERFHGLACPALHRSNLTKPLNGYEAYHSRYYGMFSEVIKCNVKIPDTSVGVYSVRVTSVGLDSGKSAIRFIAPIVETPQMTVKIGQDCYKQSNPVQCCTNFVSAAAVSAGLHPSQGRLKQCSRGSTVITMSFVSATPAAQVIQAVSNALTDPTSAVSQSYTVLSGLTTGSSAKIDRALGSRQYYACNSKDQNPSQRAKIQAFLATCKVVKIGTNSEVQCSGDIESSGCYINPTGTHAWFRSPSPQVTLCQQKTDKQGCANARYNGIPSCQWLSASWRCVAKDEYAYSPFVA